MKRPFLLSSGLLAAAFLAGPAAAQAETIVASSDGATIAVQGTAGNDDVLFLTGYKPATVEVSAMGSVVGIAAGPGCTMSASGSTAVCAVTTSAMTFKADMGAGDDGVAAREFPAEVRLEASGGDGGDEFSTAAGYLGSTRVDGGPGDDDFYVRGPGADEVIGGPGEDVILPDSSAEALNVSLNGVADDGAPGEGDNFAPDLEQFTGTELADRFSGSDGRQVLRAVGGDDVVDMGGGDDLVEAGSGNDVVVGGTGTDSLSGGEGNDRLDGGAGPDRLYGDAGDDVVGARDGEADKVTCDEGTDAATVDAPIDATFGDCEQLAATWVGAPVAYPDVPLRLGRGRALPVRVSCNARAGERCRATVRVQAPSCAKRRARCKTWARGEVTVSAGTARTVRLRLTPGVRRTFARRATTKVLVRVDVAGGSDPVRIATAVRRR